MSENFSPLNLSFVISWFNICSNSPLLPSESAAILSLTSSNGSAVPNARLELLGCFPYSETATIPIILFVYFFIPDNTVFNPAPPPIATILGPLSYIFLSNINDCTFTFFLCFILSSVASINNSIFLLFKKINPNTIHVNPITNITTTFPASLNSISFCTNIFAIP